MPHIGKVVKKGINVGLKAFFSYETDKIVQINSLKIGIIHRFIQLAIISYVIGYVMVYKHGYQSEDTAISGLITKIKGISYVKKDLKLGPDYEGIWDSQSIVVPPMENNAFFVTTNLIITKRQSRGKCAEDPSVSGAKCTSNSTCRAGKPFMLGNGYTTGACINSAEPGTKTCEIYAWCPVENDTLPSDNKPLFDNIGDYTVLIKNSIEFPRFKVKTRNVLESSTAKELSNCSYDPISDPYCPIIKLNVIFSEAGVSYEKIGIEGAIIGIHIDWQCNLDFSVESCRPTYSFRRLDDEKVKIGWKGWNYRYSTQYRDNGTEYRDLYKAYGIRFLVFVTGKARKFDFIPLTMNLGSGLALLGVATLLCDMVVLYCLRKREKYRYAKYENMEDEDALKQLMGDSTQESVQRDLGFINQATDFPESDASAIVVHS